MEKNVFSTYKTVLGGGMPSKNSEKEVEGLLPAGVQGNTKTVNDLRSQLSEAVRLQFQGLYELFDIIDSAKFSYGKFESEGIKTTFETTFKINESGVLDVSWINARAIQNNSWKDAIENAGGLPPTSMPYPIINRMFNEDDDNDNADDVEPLLPIL